MTDEAVNISITICCSISTATFATIRIGYWIWNTVPALSPPA